MVFVSGGSSFTTNETAATKAYNAKIAEDLARRNYERLMNGQSQLDSSGNAASSLADYQNLYKEILTLDDDQTKGRMSLANFYREKEGATAGQRDDQSFKRLSSQLENQRVMQDSQLGNQRFMQQKGQELTNWQRDQDYDRASRAIKGMRT